MLLVKLLYGLVIDKEKSVDEEKLAVGDGSAALNQVDAVGSEKSFGSF